MGDVRGNLDVGPSGSADYSIAIALPPGVRGVQPSLAITYSSQSRSNGPLGIGWDIGGLSDIHRCGASIHIDGFKGGINYDKNDRLCLDGERLIQIAPGVWRTERESWQKVLAQGWTTHADGSSYPTHFLVYSPDGEMREYGNTPDSRVEAYASTVVRNWSLNRVRDRRHNYYSVEYYESGGTNFPKAIAYTGNTDAAVLPTNRVEFNYGPIARTDTAVTYEAGLPVTVGNYRLGSITTYADNTKAQTWRLGYLHLDLVP